MADVAVSRLRLAAPPGRIGEARQRSEDALRLAANDEQRLLVLRRLDLGSLPPGAPPTLWTDRATLRLREQRMRAVHGAEAGAERSDAVWFHSAEEARALLLRLLATGKLPSAWFWRLAVPDWRGRPAATWFAALVSETARDASAFAALARTAIAMLAAGQWQTLAAWLSDAPTPRALQLPAWLNEEAADFSAKRREVMRRDRVERAASLLERLDSATRRAIGLALAGPAVCERARQWIARFALVASASELATMTALDELAEALLETPDAMLETHAHATTSALKQGAHAEAATRSIWEREQRQSPSPVGLKVDGERSAVEVVVPPAQPKAVTYPPEHMSPTEVSPRCVERPSSAAGALLLVHPLRRMGIGEWLAERPTLLSAGFGRALLAHIAARMRAPEDDALFAMLGSFDPADSALLEAWRIGLDRWLRRRARIKLAQLARKRGWLARNDDGVDVRFRHNDADVRVRRAALDLDPGWVEWLGLVVRYHYTDEKMP